MIFLNDIETQARKTDATATSYTITVLVGSTVLVRNATMTKSGSVFTYPGLREIVASFMKLNNLSAPFLQISWYKDSGYAWTDRYEGNVLFLEKDVRKHPSITADAFCANRFFSHLLSGWACAGDNYSLSYFLTEASGWQVDYTMSDGSVETYQGSTRQAGAGSIGIPGRTGAVKAEVTMGNRHFLIYYLEFESFERFSYRNEFNCIDTVVIPCSVTVEPSTDFEVACQENIESRYDIEEKLEMKVKSASLPSFMYARILDMLRSRFVFRSESYTSAGTTFTQSQVELYIKDYKFTNSNDPNKPISIEMTMVYSDTRRNDMITIE